MIRKPSFKFLSSKISYFHQNPLEKIGFASIFYLILSCPDLLANIYSIWDLQTIRYCKSKSTFWLDWFILIFLSEMKVLFIEETETKVKLRAQNNPGLSGLDPPAATTLLLQKRREFAMCTNNFFPIWDFLNKLESTTFGFSCY